MRGQYRSVLALGVVVFALSACAGGGGFLSGGSEAKAPRSTHLAAGLIAVEGPDGFCIDKSSQVQTGSGGFVLLAACAAISGNSDDAVPPVLAVLTVSVSALTAPDLASPDELQAFLATEAGLATLSQSGQAHHSELLGLAAADGAGGAVLIHVADTAPDRPAALADEYWRALFQANGHLINLKVAPLTSHPISEQTGHALLRAFVAKMQKANPAGETSATGL